MAEGSGSQTEHNRVQGAIDSLVKESSTHRHSARCMSLIKHLLTSGEDTILECKQSYLHSISPARVIATTRRIIIVRPSFWGLYLKHDLISPTEYSIIPYKHLISVMMSRGKILSTIHMRIHGFTDSTSSLKDEGEVYGIRTSVAVKLAKFLEEIIEYQDDELMPKVETKLNRKIAPGLAVEIRRVSLQEAQSIVFGNSSKFVWLGLEPLDHVSSILKVEKARVIRSNIAAITDAPSEDLEQYRNCVFVDYHEFMGGKLVEFLKSNYDIDSYVLKDGIRGVAHAYFEQKR